MKVSIIGGGTIGSAFADAFIRKNIVPPEHLTIIERNAVTCDELRKKFGCYVSATIYASINESDVLILATKPKDFLVVADQLNPLLKTEPLVISVMAGVTVQTIADRLNFKKDPKVVRCMPNLAVVVDSGFVDCFIPNYLKHVDIDRVSTLLNACGTLFAVKEEPIIDAATAITASGPGYLAYCVGQYIQAATDLGFDELDAKQMVLETVKGTIALLDSGKYSPETLEKKVATEGGTTEAALKVFKESRIGQTVKDALIAAAQRAKEISGS